MNSVQIKKAIDQINVTEPKFFLDKKTKEMRKFSVCKISAGNEPISIKISGDLFMLPYRNENEVYGIKYNFGVGFKLTDCALFTKILDKMAVFCPEEENWERKEVHNENGGVFLNLKPTPNSTGFDCSNNLGLKPTKLEHDKLVKNMEVQVEMSLNGWYLNDGEIKKYGITPKIKNVHFGPQDKRKKRKIDDENEIVLEDSPEPEDEIEKFKHTSANKKLLAELNN